MRILHTSDWHLGRTLHGVDLLEHQRAFLDHLVETVREREVDVVVVAGDVYDRAVPSVPTVTLLSEAFERLSDVATVIVTPGNHDSAVRLGFAARLLRPGLHVLASVDRLSEPVVVDDVDGPVAFYGLPYLDPDTVRWSLGEEGEPLARSHEAVVGAAVARVRADLAGRPGTRSVVVAHAFVVGGAASESERDIRVGGVDAVPSEVFAGFDYVALGHLHGAQAVGSGHPAIRYSGSPLAFSFGEQRQRKSTALVDLDATGGVEVQLIAAPVPRRLGELTGTLDELLSGRFDEWRDAWLRVFVTDPVHPEHLHARVSERFPHVLSLQHTPVGAVVERERRVITAETDPLEVVADFVAFATGGPASEAELRVLADAYEAARATLETSA
ncbi:Nuclease SbcCD subunit D [Frondihabitans sp. 762G35]|uniref:exonuclease SbcCD subunit D n=1 Tax=Frondihabitans sp. 762G35 TaxID=1446794 RepID=UPI000D229D18|nr:exonuclease SbcCD subunit D [Frondihabitans sp. 762G35]ARC58121.1 Nuclease SbcCD subunit D [Frondihabitans sp. 762G35]